MENEISDPSSLDIGDTATVPDIWRADISTIVQSLCERDFTLSQPQDITTTVEPTTARHMKGALNDYGETLAPLPEESWKTSYCERFSEKEWKVEVDLWTTESGRSDMVLTIEVDGLEEGYSFELTSIHVP